MKKNFVKIASMLLTASMLTGCGASAAGVAASPVSSDETEKIVKTEETVPALASSPDSTVYVVTKADGSVEKVFDTNGSSIPVDINITYTLDGKTIAPEDLTGKSGHVTVRFDYTNNSFENVDIAGENQQIYVPFTMVSGLLLNNEHFKNVDITNGKLIDDGSRTIAIGLAFPGLKENLALADYDVDVTVPEYVEISADATDFSLDMTLSVATNDVFTDIETDDINSMDDLKKDLGKLTDAMDEILEGSAKLYDGLDTLYAKVGDLTSGVTKLNDGAIALSDGASKLSDGSKELAVGAAKLSTGAGTLTAGAKELSDGLELLTANNDTLNGAAKQVFDTLLATASTQLQASGFDVTLTVDNYGEVLTGIAAQLEPDSVYLMAQNEVTKQVEAQSTIIEALVTEAFKQTVTQNVTVQVLATMGLTSEQYEACDDATKASIDEAINANVDAYMASEEGMALLQSNIEATKLSKIAEAMESAEVRAKLDAASEGLKTIVGLKVSLDSYNQFYVGLQTYTAGVASAAAGAKSLYTGSVTLKNGAGELATGAYTLSNGSTTLSNGANELRDGVKTLNDSMPALTDGVTQLRDGGKALDDGLNLFNEDGIQKLDSVVSDKVETLIDRFKATVDVAKSYKHANDADENASIKFIFRSEAIN